VRALLLVCACAACGRGASAPAQGSGAASSTSTSDASTGGPRMHMLRPDIRSLPQPAIALPMTESFTLVDAGAAPRARLRFAWDPHASREVVVAAALSSRRMEGNAWSDPLAVPAIREGFGVTTTPAAGGGATIAFRGLDAAVDGTPPPDQAARADEYLADFRDHLQRRRGTIVADDRGRLSGFAFDDASPLKAGSHDRATDDLTERWLAAAVPLPDEAVGPGARWRVVTALRAGAAIVKQTAEYTLVEARPDRWIVDEVVRRIGEDQLVDAPGLPAGAIAELIALFREQRGRVELSRALPWPVAGQVTTELRVHVKLGVPGAGVREELTEDTGTLSFSSK
jgi:hypothetical protein